MTGIAGKVVAITGASSGIGEATAVLLAGRGAKVVLGARGADRLEALAARILSGGGAVAFASVDVRRRDDLTRLVGLAGVTSPELKARLEASRDKLAMPPEAIARAIAFAIEQAADIDVNEVIVRPTAQV